MLLHHRGQVLVVDVVARLLRLLRECRHLGRDWRALRRHWGRGVHLAQRLGRCEVNHHVLARSFLLAANHDVSLLSLVARDGRLRPGLLKILVKHDSSRRSGLCLGGRHSDGATSVVRVRIFGSKIEIVVTFDMSHGLLAHICVLRFEVLQLEHHLGVLSQYLFFRAAWLSRDHAGLGWLLSGIFKARFSSGLHSGLHLLFPQIAFGLLPLLLVQGEEMSLHARLNLILARLGSGGRDVPLLHFRHLAACIALALAQDGVVVFLQLLEDVNRARGIGLGDQSARGNLCLSSFGVSAGCTQVR